MTPGWRTRIYVGVSVFQEDERRFNIKQNFLLTKGVRQCCVTLQPHFLKILKTEKYDLPALFDVCLAPEALSHFTACVFPSAGNTPATPCLSSKLLLILQDLVLTPPPLGSPH